MMTTEEFKIFTLICFALMILVAIHYHMLYTIEVKKNEIRNQLIYDTYLEIQKEIEESDEND